MNFLTLCFTIVFGLTAVFGVEGVALSRQRRRIISPPPQFVCKNDTIFKNYNTLCCNSKPAEIFSANAIAFCSKNESEALYIRDYMFNIFQDDGFFNLVYFEGLQFHRAVGKPACLAECLFKYAKTDADKKLLNADNSINYVNLIPFLKASVPQDEWSKQVEDAAKHCQPIVEKLELSSITLDKKCEFKPLAMIQCIRYNLIGACREVDEPKPPHSALNQCVGGAFAQDKCNQVFGNRYSIPTPAPTPVPAITPAP